MRSRHLAHFVPIVLLAAANAEAQTKSGWEFVVAPYFIAAGMDGEVMVRDIAVPVDVSFSSVLENLEFGGMLHLEAQKERWAVFFGHGEFPEIPYSRITGHGYR